MRAAQVTIGTMIRMTRATPERRRTAETKASPMPARFRWKSAHRAACQHHGLTVSCDAAKFGARRFIGKHVQSRTRWVAQRFRPAFGHLWRLERLRYDRPR